MKELITPITSDNLQENWELVDKERRTAKKKYLTTRVASFFSNMLFSLLAVIVSNGLIHDHFSIKHLDNTAAMVYNINQV